MLRFHYEVAWYDFIDTEKVSENKFSLKYRKNAQIEHKISTVKSRRHAVISEK